ncbi:MAG TPA: two-component regulator propeller domain-containing protein [Verrucomicrobiae bacterium]|nr:two-component regulator propeller domain-containing protein [Verrucomicrobiae bacterium]
MDFNIRVWQAEDGLPNNIVQAIAQTPDGYLWVGTREGLALFDGEQFHMVELTQESSQPSITCLLACADGSLWIGTEGSGVYFFSKSKFERCQVSGGNNNFDVLEIQQGGDGTFWFATSRGIFYSLDDKLQRLAAIRNQQARFCADNGGKIWVCDGNLKQINPPPATNVVVTPVKVPRATRCFYCDTEGIFWIGTDYGVANSLIKIQDGVVTNFPREAGPSGFVSSVYQDSYGNIWVGSYSGLSRFVDGKFIPTTISKGSPCRIYCLFEDREHDVWVGSEEGLTRLTPNRFKTISKADGLSGNTVVSVSPSSQGGVWIGIWGGGVNHYLDGNISYLNKTKGLKSDFVMGITEVRDGSLWMGTDYNGPLQHFSNGVVTSYGHDEGFIAGAATEVLCEDQSGLLWIGTRDGLQTWDGTKFNRFTIKDGLGNNRIDAICRGPGNDMWIATDNGLTRWHDGKLENLGAKNPRLQVWMLSLYQDSEGTLWIGTKRDGLFRWHDGELQEFNRKTGLYNDTIYSILEDGHSNFWLNSSRGIFRISKRQLESVAAGDENSITSVTYGRADGIVASGQYRNITQPAACKDSRGRLWFRTTQGVVMVDPDLLSINQQAPPVVIEEINANRVNVTSKNLNVDVSRPFVIPPGQGSLEIRYTALSYTAPGKNMYRYKLAPADTAWVNAGNSRVARYMNLRPGTYRFQVAACNNDGVWNEQGQTATLVFQPHFWQTWWFALLVGGTILGLVAGTVRYVTRRRLQRKLIQLEQRHAVERERSRIARDVHDELGSKLTEISFQGSIAQCNLNDPVETRRQIERMSASAREAVSSLQEIIWAADPENDTLEGLVGHISHFVEEFFRMSGINGEVSAPERIADQKIPAMVRHNLYLAVKEAINNSAKHANATRILIQISIPGDSLEVLISDNGNGFVAELAENAAEKPKRPGHGLANMRERLRVIGGQCEISSEPSQGTTVRFVVSLKGSMFM